MVNRIIAGFYGNTAEERNSYRSQVMVLLASLGLTERDVIIRDSAIEAYGFMVVTKDQKVGTALKTLSEKIRSETE